MKYAPLCCLDPNILAAKHSKMCQRMKISIYSSLLFYQIIDGMITVIMF